VSAADVLDRLAELGITARTSGENLLLEPGSKVPPDLLVEVRAHKAEVLALLRREAVGPLDGYRQVYAGDAPGTDELAELEERVNREGFVLCRSMALEDFVVFHRDDVDPATLPPGFVPYSVQELERLFGDGTEVAASTLRLIHQAKKLGGGAVISSEGEP
jgi:hypothetical protein